MPITIRACSKRVRLTNFFQTEKETFFHRNIKIILQKSKTYKLPTNYMPVLSTFIIYLFIYLFIFSCILPGSTRLACLTGVKPSYSWSISTSLSNIPHLSMVYWLNKPPGMLEEPPGMLEEHEKRL